MARRPTDTEWNDELSVCFPNLIRDDVWITAEPTTVYNCIAYSLGYTDRWINPPDPLAPFQRLYTDHGHQTLASGAGNAQIDGWRNAAMTHGSRTSTTKAAPLWESKLGESFRLTHGRNQLDGQLYGTVVTSFS